MGKARTIPAIALGKLPTSSSSEPSRSGTRGGVSGTSSLSDPHASIDSDFPIGPVASSQLEVREDAPALAFPRAGLEKAIPQPFDTKPYLDSSEKMNVTERIQHLRKITGMTVSEFARVWHVSRQSVHSWINGDKYPSDKHLDLISNLEEAERLLLQYEVAVQPAVFRRKIAGSPTMLEALEKSGDAVVILRDHLPFLQKEEQEWQHMQKVMFKGKPPKIGEHTLFGAPHLRGDD